MDSDRKYSQRGYQDHGNSNRSNGNREEGRRDDRKPQGPKLPLDVTGPRLPRLVQAVTASRCWNCSTTLDGAIAVDSHCPKCGSALHCCKQCTHFEPSTRFQCLKPIPERVNKKDIANECTFFKARVTVARDTPAPRPGLGSPLAGGPVAHSKGMPQGAGRPLEDISAPRNAQDARAAFASLFKK
jgi:hypothetical protein